MYLGNFVEVSDKFELYEKPLHPYTQALLSAIPIADPTVKRERIILKGSIPSALNPPSGCKFHTRCPKAMDICKVEAPKKTVISDKHYVFCHLYNNK
jgi:peptide/nickel transport system ATP-binding protein/oligopeptide transport system ATP-binding protein